MHQHGTALSSGVGGEIGSLRDGPAGGLVDGGQHPSQGRRQAAARNPGWMSQRAAAGLGRMQLGHRQGRAQPASKEQRTGTGTEGARRRARPARPAPPRITTSAPSLSAERSAASLKQASAPSGSRAISAPVGATVRMPARRSPSPGSTRTRAASVPSARRPSRSRSVGRAGRRGGRTPPPCRPREREEPPCMPEGRGRRSRRGRPHCNPRRAPRRLPAPRGRRSPPRRGSRCSGRRTVP